MKIKNNSNFNKLYSLSKREVEITHLILEGIRVSEIAKELGIKINTVSTIKKNIFYKTGVRNSIDLYRLFFGGGDIDSVKKCYDFIKY